MTKNHDFDVTGFLPYLLNQAAEASALGFQRVYKARYGMLRAEWRVLFHLGRHGEMSARDICRLGNMHKTKVSRAVQKLADRRYLNRTRDPDDRRSERLALTPAGLRAYADLRAVAQDYDRALLAGFAPSEAAALRSALRQLAGLT